MREEKKATPKKSYRLLYTRNFLTIYIGEAYNIHLPPVPHLPVLHFLTHK